jgi:hypothetical protein
MSGERDAARTRRLIEFVPAGDGEKAPFHE